MGSPRVIGGRGRLALAVLVSVSVLVPPPVGAAEPQPALQLAGLADGSISIVASEVDAQGNAVVLWLGSDTTARCYDIGCYSSLYASAYEKGKGWGEAAVVVNGSSSAPTFAPYSYYTVYELAADGRGNFTFAFVAYDPYGRLGGSVQARQFRVGTGWGPTVQLSGGNFSSSRAAVAFDASGAGVVGWVATEYDYTFEYNATVWASRYDPGVGWQAAEALESEAGYNLSGPGFAMDGRGGITALWSREGSIRSAAFEPGVGWGEVEVISNETGLWITDTRVAKNGEGGVFAVFTGYGSTSRGYEMRALRRLPGHLWEAPVNLRATDFGNALYAQVSAAGDGGGLVVFAQGFAPGAHELFAVRSAAVGGWEPAVRLDTSGQGDGQFVVAQDGFGAAVVLWPEVNRGSPGARVVMNRYDPQAGWQGAFDLYSVRAGYVYLPGASMSRGGDLLLAWTAGGSTSYGGSFPNELWARWWAPEELVTGRITLLPPEPSTFPAGGAILVPLAVLAAAAPAAAWLYLGRQERHAGEKKF